MRSKIIFLDFDGTLTNEIGEIPTSAIQAIRLSRKQGNKVFLSTGRSLAELHDWILNIGFDGIIGAGGAYIEIDGVRIRDYCFDQEELLQIMDFLNLNGIDYILEASHGLYGTLHCYEYLKRMLPPYEREQEYINLIKFQADLRQVKDISKIIFLGSDVPFDYIQRQFQERYLVLPSSIPVYGSESGELALKNVHKADAIQQVLSYLHIDQKDSYAFGDSLNDMEMIQYVHTGIVMQNGHPNLLKIADDIAHTADHDGIYKSFQKHGLL